MTATRPAKENPDQAPNSESGGQASRDKEGGAPATEEDIGTESAGTEPADASDRGSATGTVRRDKS